MYEIVKRHGETYVYEGQTCIAIATEAGEKGVEELVKQAQRAVQESAMAGLLKELVGESYAFRGTVHPKTITTEKANEIRALLGLGPVSEV